MSSFQNNLTGKMTTFYIHINTSLTVYTTTIFGRRGRGMSVQFFFILLILTTVNNYFYTYITCTGHNFSHQQLINLNHFSSTTLFLSISTKYPNQGSLHGPNNRNPCKLPDILKVTLSEGRFLGYKVKAD